MEYITTAATVKAVSVAVAGGLSMLAADTAAHVMAQADPITTGTILAKIAEHGLLAALASFLLYVQERRLNRQENVSITREERMARRIDNLETQLVEIAKMQACERGKADA